MAGIFELLILPSHKTLMQADLVTLLLPCMTHLCIHLIILIHTSHRSFCTGLKESFEMQQRD
jgi:hypothetical protein